jgi:hypothetical protein
MTKNSIAEKIRLEPPPLPRFNGSWIVKRKVDGEVLGEFFEAESVRQFNSTTCEAVPIGEHLASLNKRIKSNAKSDRSL